MAAPNLRRLTPRAHLALALVGTFLSACAGEGDVDRVQPDAIDKTIFLKEDGYAAALLLPRDDDRDAAHQRLCVRRDDGRHVEGPLRHPGEVPGRIPRLRLRAGIAEPEHRGGNNTDTPALIYAIQSHFDVKREYNPATGEETNVISENTSDRPWNDRQYMRVDWSRNQAVAARKRRSDGLRSFRARRLERHRDRRERRLAVQPGPPDLHPRLHRLQRPGDPHARLFSPATGCSAATTRSGPGVAATPRSPSATR